MRFITICQFPSALKIETVESYLQRAKLQLGDLVRCCGKTLLCHLCVCIKEVGFKLSLADHSMFTRAIDGNQTGNSGTANYSHLYLKYIKTKKQR